MFKNCFENCNREHLWFFVGGIAAAVAGKAVAKSDSVRKLAVKGMASGMKLQQDAAYKLETMKEDAQDLVQEQAKAEKE